MAKPSKGMTIALVVGIIAILAIAAGWWYYGVKKANDDLAAAAAASFDKMVEDANRASKAVEDNFKAVERLKKNW